jgi:hypothetical protein
MHPRVAEAANCVPCVPSVRRASFRSEPSCLSVGAPCFSRGSWTSVQRKKLRHQNGLNRLSRACPSVARLFGVSPHAFRSEPPASAGGAGLQSSERSSVEKWASAPALLRTIPDARTTSREINFCSKYVTCPARHSNFRYLVSNLGEKIDPAIQSSLRSSTGCDSRKPSQTKSPNT